jgi:hypothetical protein
MNKYIVKNKEGIETNSWLSSFADGTHYEPCFGKPERWVLHKDEPFGENYDEADVLEERTVEDTPGTDAVMDDTGAIVQEAMPPKTHREVKLRAEYTVEVVDITEAMALEKLSVEALRYLEATDWYIIREMDSGVPCPVEIKQARAEARTKAVR